MYRKKVTGYSLLCCIRTDGNVFVAITKGTNNAGTFGVFILCLINFLNHYDPHWRNGAEMLLNNATFHKCELANVALGLMNIRVCYTAPASYGCCPVKNSSESLSRSGLIGKVEGNESSCLEINQSNPSYR